MCVGTKFLLLKLFQDSGGGLVSYVKPQFHPAPPHHSHCHANQYYNKDQWFIDEFSSIEHM